MKVASITVTKETTVVRALAMVSLLTAVLVCLPDARFAGADEPKPQPKPAGKDGIRLWQYVKGDTREFFTYGLKVVPPWEDGGHLRINFPEHLESMPGTRGILRYSDAKRFGDKATGRWVVSADGMTATLNAPSAEQPGVFVEGHAKVVSRNRIDFSMRITNKTERKTLGAIRPLYCFQYQPLKGFPGWQQNFKHTFWLQNGKLIALADIKTEKPDARVKGGGVKGCPDQSKSTFVMRRGGWIDGGLDRAISVVTSLDGKRAMVFAWTPGKCLLSNSVIPCLHADPYYGDIKPGESKIAHGVLILTEDDPAKIVRQFVDQGLGAPPKEK